jgi:hypothetical protein
MKSASVLLLSLMVIVRAQPYAKPAAVQLLLNRLELTAYKEAIRGLTQFGDRREGTDRNRSAVDWIEATLESYGCADVERIKYSFPSGGIVTPKAQREEVYCTKIGKTHPDEMYIVSAHMDGTGGGEAANDDASGTALVLELARILNAPEVETDRSIRFALWNNEETGMQGSHAYVVQRRDMQGKESPTGSGKYPEPRWLGMIQHDMMLFDHGMPDKNGNVASKQRAEADINIEFQAGSRMAAESAALAWAFQSANEKWESGFPATVGSHMNNTDSIHFAPHVAAISLRENERDAQIGRGWNPHWHRATDLLAAYTDDDFRLGLSAAKTTLGAVAQLVGARLR